MWGYSRLSCTPLIYVSILMTVLHCLDFGSFVVSFEMESKYSNFVLFQDNFGCCLDQISQVLSLYFSEYIFCSFLSFLSFWYPHYTYVVVINSFSCFPRIHSLFIIPLLSLSFRSINICWSIVKFFLSFSLLVQSYCWVPPVKFSSWLLYFLTPKFPFGSFF